MISVAILREGEAAETRGKSTCVGKVFFVVVELLVLEVLILDFCELDHCVGLGRDSAACDA